MRDKIEQIKQAVAAGQIPREQGADMIGRIVQAEDPELFAGLSAQNAQNKMQQAAASQAGVPGPVQFQRPSPSQPLTEDQVRARDREIMGEGDAGRGLPSGIPPQVRQKIQGYSVPGSPMTTPPQQYIPQGAQPAGGFPIGTGPGSTMGNPPQGISEANIPEGYNDPSLMRGSGMPPQMVGGQPRTVDPQLRNEGILSREMANRPKAGPSSIMGGLRSAGKSAGGYMKSLFNDPQRMAMLQGGLSMMDPNTYYDKDNFGSVFTGLNKGLGAATAGHAGVLARRKAVSDRKLVDAKAGAEGVNADKISIGATRNSVLAINKSMINRKTRQYMREGMSEDDAYALASMESSSNVTDKGMSQKDINTVFEEYSTANITLDKIRRAKKLVKPENLSGLATLKRGFDTALTFGQITHNPSESTELKVIMDELAGPMLQAVLGIPLNSKLLDSQKEKDFIKDLSGNPSKYTDPVILAQKLDMIEKLYIKLQGSRRKTLGYGDDASDGGSGYSTKYDY